MLWEVSDLLPDFGEGVMAISTASDVSPEPKFAELLDRFRVHVVHLGPEDLVVLETPDRLTLAEQTALREAWERALPGIRAITLDNGMTLRAILRKAEKPPNEIGRLMGYGSGSDDPTGACP